MLRKTLLSCCILVLLLGSTAYSADIYVRSITMPYYFQTYYADENTDRLPVYQFLSTSLADFGAQGLSIHASGWGRIESMDRPNFEPWEQVDQNDEELPIGDGDLTYGFLQYEGPENLFTIRAGRMMLGPSLIVEPFDGGSFVGRFPIGLNLTWFGGAPVVSSIGDREGDWIFGGRLDYALDPFFEFAATYTKKIEERTIDNEIAGLQLNSTPLPWFAFSGHIYFDTRMAEVYDGESMAVFRPLGGSKIIALYERVTPSTLLGKASPLSVFTMDAYHHGQLATTFVFMTHLEARAEYGIVAFEDKALGDPSHRASGGLAVIYGKQLANSLGIQYVYLNDPQRGYNQARMYYRQGFAKRLFCTADVAGTLLDEEIYEQDVSLSATGTFGIDITDYFQIVGSTTYVQNPFYEDEVRGLLKLSFNVDKTFWSSDQ
ncbi:MAG: hypothetical protein P9M14_09415 [Candidatus Alcyoniella australis]|nr:hypothetical protein [Candidatus Alcyoniella australis]